MQRRHFLLPALAAGTTLIAGCAGLFGPRTVEVSQAQLEELLARRFPLTRRVLEIFDVTVSAPLLRLLPDANRIATDFELASKIGRAHV